MFKGIIVTFGLIFISSASVESLYEGDRVEEYHRRGHEWPPRETDFIPNTEGWKNIFKRRLSQLNYIDDSRDRYNGYMFSVYGGLLGNNFTEHGFGLTKAPAAIVAKLKESLRNGMMAKENLRTETDAAAIETDNRPFFIDQDELNSEVLHQLLPLHESWAGVKLVPNNAYGLRVYRNNSSLNMHVDKTGTHIISSILHVSHDESMENWPIIIEDFQGNTNEVYLEDGDMLFYESSKCLHGRPKKMNGEWYTSLFIHYYPADWDAHKVDMDAHYRIPPGWNNVYPQEDKKAEDLVVRDTSVKEPECEHEWCALANSVKIYGPAPGYGKVLTTGGEIEELVDIPREDEFNSIVHDDL